MRSIGVHRGVAHQTFASQTAAHDSSVVMSRLMLGARVVDSPLSTQIQGYHLQKKTGSVDSSQRTHFLSAPSSLTRTDFGSVQTATVRSAIGRARAGGAVAPKKKGAKRS
jgi:hypothetical protein